MTAVLVLIGCFLFVLYVLAAAADQLWGPDTDLGGWQPGDRPDDWWK